MRFHGVLRSVVAVAAAGVAVASMPGVASAAQFPYRRSTRCSDNGAGVEWHPKGDWFEVWDNVADGKPAYVYWCYHQKRATHNFDHKARSSGKHSRITKYDMDESRKIDFYVWSQGCSLRDSPIVYYRTSGT